MRIQELNKRLLNRPQEADNLWWESFAFEFFDDDARLTITAYFDEGLKSFSIGRKLIARYFRSWFEDGVTDCYLVPRMAKETFMGNVIMIECDMASQIATHTKVRKIAERSEAKNAKLRFAQTSLNPFWESDQLIVHFSEAKSASKYLES